jgi:peptide/nickel transport system ATP-binding protein
MSALLALDHLTRRFKLPGKHELHAVDDVTLAIAPGESVGLVGESGCGKSTLARLAARLIDVTGGGILFDGKPLGDVPAKNFALAAERSAVQMVFQDPTDSLNPRYTAFDTIAEPLKLLAKMRDADAIRARVAELADQVGLPRELLPRFPHQLSGGQKARVGIARAIAVKPKLLILDEPTAALDVSVQAIILNLLADLREQLGMSYLFVSHDLNVIRLVCDRVVVMYLGKVVESGPVQQVFDAPLHPYTQALVTAIPGVAREDKIRLAGEPRSPIDPPSTVCRFFGRCPIGHARCEEEMPKLEERQAGRFVACHTPLGRG